MTFSGVGKVYLDGHRAVQGLDLEIADGEFMVFVGPSGCGKTTALRMVAGLEEITEGEILLGEQPISTIPPHRRDVAMVFQNYALYPHMSVFENMAFPLRCRGIKSSEMRGQVERAAARLGLTEMLKRRPKTLSGGQRQRVAMGRAIVRQPQVFLMDEPLSNLDAKLRTQMRAEIAALQRDLGVTTIYVTHDQIEAMTMGSRIAVMRKGILQQQGSPQDLFNNPTNLFVASFIGSPAMNLFKARLETDAGALSCVLRDSNFRLPDTVTQTHPRLSQYGGRDVAVGIRPDYISHADGSTNGAPTVEGRVQVVEMLGAEQLVHVNIAADPVLTDEVLEVASDTDAAVLATLEQEAAAQQVPLIARLGADVPMSSGQTTRIALQPGRLHFFDLETGASLR
jgi:multiple sugar transport system ATP-binding protein